MNKREMTIELLAQTLAPRLFKFFGTPPEEMGFPIYDTPEEVEDHLAKQFDPISYWTDRGREIVVSIFNILEVGGAVILELDIAAMCKAALLERPDATATIE